MKTLYSLILAASLSTSLFAQEDGPGNNWTEVNLAVTDHQVIPSYQAFALAAGQLEIVAGEFCNSPDTAGLESFRQAFHGAMDGWQQIQHVQFGPITYFNWNYRLQFWPDDNGTGGRQLTALLAGQDETQLAPEVFAGQSVGVQGYPALERLLFDADSLQQLQDEPFYCRVVQTVAANLAEMSAGVESRWREEFRTTVANADERGFFESAEDATIDFLKALVEGTRRVQQQKIESVLGEDRAGSRVRLAESWRSDRSIRNIKLNVAAFHAIFEDSVPSLSEVFVPDDVPGILAAFENLEGTLATLPDSMNVALETDQGFQGLQSARDDLDALFETLEAALKNTDLYLGFNSLDGD